MKTETKQFKAEIGRMLDLVVNSLYSKKEIFLRELLSNASDAIDRAKYLGLVDKELLADAPDWKITIVADKAQKLLSISDNPNVVLCIINVILLISMNALVKKMNEGKGI